MIQVNNSQFNRQIFLIIGFMTIVSGESVGYILSEISTDGINPLTIATHLLSLGLYLPVLIFLQNLLSAEPVIKKSFHWIIATEILYIPALFISENDNGIMQLYAMTIFFTMLFSYFLLCIRLLNIRYTSHPLIKPLRPFAIAMIIGMVLNFVIGIIAAAEASSLGTGIAYIVGTIPFIFLIFYFTRIKKIYPDILNGTYKIHEDIDENWPPEKKE